MNTGYLCISTHPDHPGLLRLFTRRQAPQLSDGRETGPESIRYGARFNDVQAARMHTHNLLRHGMLDPDACLYRIPLVQAIAAVESLGLAHERAYLDPGLEKTLLAQITQATRQLQVRRKRRNRLIDAIGYLALGILLFHALATLLR